MTTGTAIQFKRTAFYALHKAAGARMVEFAGWEMPVEYSGIVAEHMSVRTAAGLFDVSHMGEIEIRGREALALVQFVTSNDASRLKDFQAQYTALMYPQGSAVDDCVLHRLGENHYFLCVNAANTEKDFAWIVSHNRDQSANSSAAICETAASSQLRCGYCETSRAPVASNTTVGWN